ncbi:MAG: Penicillin-binding protein, 1A family [Candidatus Daviesbacteria bacterium GW2011_GWA1_41_61]|uniref:Penicillin-binding protein, 1A family n=1 Tax=Candidatus Daviesbacteria bacterium GW2011_GWA2_40_9 TaxID=1618424 RepID=A0A0G0X830_9BACT|nr:MAG: Penicillin-binding protein, 1A family [Candidatus Daviesbacteria bacterium GW2011_GWA2_40_9]KKR93416.1 MAG: Penicillin-binding protein, 1A family [Candidatus Daviesbacteria bacterium GW2011_GWB1_41_15]KKS15035.1 MAG: Penicillin-binding protein, 1A family [Candidatus Daviesbacteria bacterium GW2011_GWA1_41_61]
MALGGILLTILIIIFFVVQVPSPSELANRDLAAATKIYDRNGELLYDIFKDQNRTPVNFEDIPVYVRQATIAIEDKDFYKHQGFSMVGITRAFSDSILSRKIEGGGSTLTQQLVKNTLLSNEQTFTRKIKEFILAVQVERAYSKDQILEMYLNEIPYGGTAYGIEAAANLYFGKHAKDLDLAESSLLAGLPQRPSVYSPYGTSPERSKTRQIEVLRRMLEDGYITKQQVEEAKNEELIYRTSKNEVGFKAPHFVLYIKKMLIEQYGEKVVEEGGLRVTTSLDYKLQEKVQEIVKAEVKKIEKYNATNGAAVVLDPQTGHILAMVGSKDYFAQDYDGNYNAVLALRQPGSATKPITYAASMQKGYTASSVLMDVKTEFPGGEGLPTYIPINYDGQWHGPTQVRYALGNSYNIPAVKVLALVGVKNVMDLGYRMGLSTWEPTEENVNNVGLSLTLGGREVRLLDLTSAFGVLAGGGVKHDPTPILKVTDTSGKTLYEYQNSEGIKILEEGIAFIISNILSDNGARSAAFGSNSILNVPGKTVAVKTGTTDEKRDNWTVGFTPSVVVGVWVGNNDNSKMNPTIASGVTGASPIWQKIMIEALKEKGDEKPKTPDEVSYADIDGLMGGQPKDGSPTRKEFFIKGTEPTSASLAYQRQKVCKSNPHRLANDGEDLEERDVILLQENDPTGADKWQVGIDTWVLTAADGRFVGAGRGCSGIPGFSGGGGGGAISIVNVSNGANVPRIFDVLAQTNSPNGVKKVTWIVDGAVKSTQTSEPFAVHIEFPEGDRGSHTITTTLEDNNGQQFSTAIGVTVAL